MSTNVKTAPLNVYVNLDCTAPASLRLKGGQNLLFVRSFRCAGGAFVRSLYMPAPCFVTADDVAYGTAIVGQPPGTYIVALALVHSEGTGEIVIRFEAQSSGASRCTERTRFTITR
jgi:hypothetical protein